MTEKKEIKDLNDWVSETGGNVTELLDKAKPILKTPLGRLKRRFEALEKGKSPVPLPGCMPAISEAMGGGFWPGNHVLVGSTGAGKSQFCIQVVNEAIKSGHPVFYITLELDDWQCLCRLACTRIGYKWSGVLTGKGCSGVGAETLRDEVLKEAEKIHDKLRIQQQPAYGFDIEAMTRELESWAEKNKGLKTPLVVLDYLQLIDGGEGQETRTRIQQAAYMAREAARTHDLAVLLVSSTARAYYPLLSTKRYLYNQKGEPRENRDALGKGAPGRLLGIGKESGEIEYSAESVIVLGKEQWEGDTPPMNGTTIWFGLAKNRVGFEVWQKAKFDGLRFELWDSQKEAEAERNDYV